MLTQKNSKHASSSREQSRQTSSSFAIDSRRESQHACSGLHTRINMLIWISYAFDRLHFKALIQCEHSMTMSTIQWARNTFRHNIAAQLYVGRNWLKIVACYLHTILLINFHFLFSLLFFCFTSEKIAERHALSAVISKNRHCLSWDLVGTMRVMNSCSCLVPDSIPGAA